MAIYSLESSKLGRLLGAIGSDGEKTITKNSQARDGELRRALDNRHGD